MNATTIRSLSRAALVFFGALSLLVPQTALTSTVSTHSLPVSSVGRAHLGTAACVQPPQSTDLLTLSDAGLQSYGLPSHAIINENPQFWARALAHAKSRTCGTAPTRPHRQLRGGQSCPTPAQAGEICQNNTWAANNTVQNDQRGVFRGAYVEFNVPTISLSPTNASVFIWAGVGGNEVITNPAVLVQAGVLVEPIWNGSTYVEYHESWWEVVPFPNPNNFAQNLPLSRLNAGDHVAVYVSSNANNDGDDYFYIENVSANNYNSCTLYTTNPNVADTCPLDNGGYAQGSSSYNSDSAGGECVVERPTDAQTNQPVPLAEFNPPSHTEELSSCAINGTAVGAQSHFDMQMTDSNGGIIAKCGPIDGTGENFPVYWYKHQ